MTSLHILTVADCPDAATDMARLLQHYGHHVQRAPDVRTAIERARVDQPDVVLLDIGLADTDDLDVAHQLREILFDKPPLIIAVTSDFPAPDPSCLEESCIDVCLVKPFDPMMLRNILSRFARVVSCCP
jgi:CheY-like chemotaxis protein